MGTRYASGSVPFVGLQSCQHTALKMPTLLPALSAYRRSVEEENDGVITKDQLAEARILLVNAFAAVDALIIACPDCGQDYASCGACKNYHRGAHTNDEYRASHVHDFSVTGYAMKVRWVWVETQTGQVQKREWYPLGEDNAICSDPRCRASRPSLAGVPLSVTPPEAPKPLTVT